MDKNDKKDTRLIMGEVLEEVVLPRFQKLDDDVGVLKDDVNTLKDDVSGLKDDVKGMKDNIEDLQDTTHRIENKLDVEIQRKDIFSAELSSIKKKVYGT